MVLMIVAQPTNALVHASSMTNMMDYPYLHATCRKYLQSVVAFLDLIIFHRAGHNGRHMCVTRHYLTSELRPDGPCSCGEMPHQCGKLCALHLKDGCLQKCCKVNATSFP